MVSELGIGLGLVLTVVVVALHFSRGTEWTPNEDISDELLERRAASLPETDFPEPMNRSIGGGGVATAAVAAEGEAGGELAEAEETVDDDNPASIPDDEAEVFEVEYVKEGSTIEVRENQTLLDAGEDEGWDLPYACREGQCISCAGRVTNGGNAEEYLQHYTNSMLGEEELSKGYTLTCVAYPTADLSLETGESP